MKTPPKDIHNSEQLRASPAARGIKPGSYADRGVLLDNYESEAEEADQLLAQLDGIPLEKIGQRGRPQKGDKRKPIGVYSMKMP